MKRYASFIFSKKFSRYQNSEIFWCLNITALSNLYMYIRSLTTVSSRVGASPFLKEPHPLSGYPPLSEANLKNYPPLSESHPNWCKQIVWNTLKWRSYILHYTKSIENITIITLYTFRLNSVFTTDSLVRYCL